MASRPWLVAIVLLGCLTGTCALAGCGAASYPSRSLAALDQTALPVQTGSPDAGEPTAMEPPNVQPTIVQQTTAAPVQTAPAPTTPAQEVPAQPTSADATPTTPDLTPASSARTIPPLLWVLIAVTALALIGLIVWLVHSSSRRSDIAAAWQNRRLSAYAEGAALHDAIMSAQEQQGRLSPGDDMVRWTDIQRRADNFNQRLYQLRDMAPDEDGAARAENVLTSLQAVRSAVDAERSSGIPGGMTADIVASRLGDFRISLHTLRSDY